MFLEVMASTYLGGRRRKRCGLYPGEWVTPRKTSLHKKPWWLLGNLRQRGSKRRVQAGARLVPSGKAQLKGWLKHYLCTTFPSPLSGQPCQRGLFREAILTVFVHRQAGLNQGNSDNKRCREGAGQSHRVPPSWQRRQQPRGRQWGAQGSRPVLTPISAAPQRGRGEKKEISQLLSSKTKEIHRRASQHCKYTLKQ